jgi:hypothetical protein
MYNMLGLRFQDRRQVFVHYHTLHTQHKFLRFGFICRRNCESPVCGLLAQYGFECVDLCHNLCQCMSVCIRKAVTSLKFDNW